jgi:predicted Zn-dependent protease
MVLSEDDVRAIASKIIAGSRAETCTVSIAGSYSRNFRFARSDATTNGAVTSVGISIHSSFGTKSGSASVNALDEAEIERARARSEEIARLSPDNPEFMPPIGPQAYERNGRQFDPEGLEIGAPALAGAARSAIEAGHGRDITVAGFVETKHSVRAVANSAGLFAHERRTNNELTVSARSTSRAWSGWAGASQNRFGEIDAKAIGRRAAEKAVFPGSPADLDPGSYTVILEPAAVADLLVYLVGSMDARSADEGRSFLSKPGGGTKLGERLLSECVTITSDPADRSAPDTVYGEDGLPKKKTVWFENGVARTLKCSRFWAQKTGRDPIPGPVHFSMAGGSASVGDMIRDTKLGLLITRLWYIRSVDPRTLLLTGMTRDGNFLIENGKITRPALNLRFNESPVSVLSKVEAVGPAERAIGSETYEHAISAPPLLIKSFAFSSRSSGI